MDAGRLYLIPSLPAWGVLVQPGDGKLLDYSNGRSCLTIRGICKLNSPSPEHFSQVPVDPGVGLTVSIAEFLCAEPCWCQEPGRPAAGRAGLPPGDGSRPARRASSGTSWESSVKPATGKHSSAVRMQVLLSVLQGQCMSTEDTGLPAPEQPPRGAGPLHTGSTPAGAAQSSWACHPPSCGSRQGAWLSPPPVLDFA